MSFQVDINKIREIISENNFLSDSEQENFLNILEMAQATLSEGFDGESSEDNANKKFYDYAFNLIDGEFDTFIKSIENMRSSYLPSEVFNATLSTIDGGDSVESIIEEVSSGSTPLESYQNAFFRMVGLPSWEDIEADKPNAKLHIVDTNGNLDLNFVNSNNIYSSFLDRRQAFSTIGCSAGVSYFDLVSSSETASDFLKKKSYSDEAITFVEQFSSILSATFDATEEQKTILDGQYIDFISKLLSIETDQGDLFDKVESIYKLEKRGGDPLSWIELKLVDFSAEESVITNYSNFLLFIHYAFISDNPSNFLTNNDINNLYKRLVLKEPTDDSINNLEKNIYTYSSLLFPMVKDGRISGCINDPDKMIADPFLPITKRMVNGRFLRSTLLESIIRIRTDVISGTTSYLSQDVPYIIGEDNEKGIEQESVSGELLGYLESLLIIRMLDALEALANGTKKNIEQISANQRRTGKGLFGSCYDTVRSAVPVAIEKPSPERIMLNNYALIEDSIMLLLGTKDTDEDSLSLQSSVNRDSSIPNSYLMSSLVNIVQIPRKYINQRIQEDDRKLRTEASVGSKVASNIETTIGIRSGVGIIDLIAVIIALLTIDEVNLVSLMTKSQIENMYRQINPDTFDEDKRRMISENTIETAVNNFTERVNTVYSIFVNFLKN
jgi:hypothetical protein